MSGEGGAIGSIALFLFNMDHYIGANYLFAVLERASASGKTSSTSRIFRPELLLNLSFNVFLFATESSLLESR